MKGGYSERIEKLEQRTAGEKSMMTGGDDAGAEAEDRIIHQKKVEQFTEQKSVTEISVDLVLQAKAFSSDNKVSGPEDSVVSGLIEQLPLAKCLRDYEVLPGTGRKGLSREV